METAFSEELQNKFQPVPSSTLDDYEDFAKRVDETNRLLSKILSGEDDDEMKEKFEKLIAGGNQNQKNNCEPKERQISKSTVTTGLKKRNSPSPSINKTTVNTSVPAEKVPEMTDLRSDTMSSDAFMKIVEADANKRSVERAERNKKAGLLMTEGNKAFKEGKFERALYFYNQAIDVRRDNSILFVNRALTHLRLGLYTKACSDCDHALKLKETLKARLYKGRALFEMAEEEAAINWMDATEKLFPTDVGLIKEYMADWKKDK